MQYHKHGNEVHNSMPQDADPGVLSHLYGICHEQASGQQDDQIPLPEEMKLSE